MRHAELNLITIRAADLDRAARFYEALGIKLDRERHGSGPEHLAGFAGLVVFEIYPAAEAGTTLAVRIGFRVPSVVDAYAAALEAGGAVETPPRSGTWGLRAVVADPDGHRVELSEVGGDA